MHDTQATITSNNSAQPGSGFVYRVVSGALAFVLRRELVVEEVTQHGHEVGGRERRAIHRNADLRRVGHERRVEVVVIGQEDTRDREPKQVLKRLAALLGRPMAQVSILGVAQDLNALVREVLGVSNQHQTGPVHVALGHQPLRGIDLIDRLNR